MTVQKFVTYSVLNTDGQVSNQDQKLELKVLENSGNYLIHKDITRHKVLAKQGTGSSKTRSEVRGGGRKPWRQKGTGRARAGSNRSPLWKGGGVIFGPKPKVATFKLNQKERKLALQTLLYNNRNYISFVENLENDFIDIKTKGLVEILTKLNFSLHEKTLIIVSKKTPALLLSARNIKNVELISASTLNTLSLIKSKNILLTVSALNDIKEIYCD
uniref:Large ribosomal subunit protein uL4c n=1 Tax=Triparma laevis TaxID=1534972 RepID=A0A0K2RWE1_9STRA|nr:chloroplast 50S ribosomal protein L4 [Triparma laevis]BAS19105.1 chloroplast 50S ribosomal protein L4 [Triparma laevis]